MVLIMIFDFSCAIIFLFGVDGYIKDELNREKEWKTDVIAGSHDHMDDLEGKEFLRLQEEGHAAMHSADEILICTFSWIKKMDNLHSIDRLKWCICSLLNCFL